MKKLFYLGMAAVITILLIISCSAKIMDKGNGSYADDLNFENKYYINHSELTITDTSKIKKLVQLKNLVVWARVMAFLRLRDILIIVL